MYKRQDSHPSVERRVRRPKGSSERMRNACQPFPSKSTSGMSGNGRSPGSRFRRPFPLPSARPVDLGGGSQVTVAGPRRSLTGFPVRPSGTVTDNNQCRQDTGKHPRSQATGWSIAKVRGTQPRVGQDPLGGPISTPRGRAVRPSSACGRTKGSCSNHTRSVAAPMHNRP